MSIVCVSLFTTTQGTAHAGRGILSASCNSDAGYYQAFGPHIFVDSRDLRPVGGAAQQYVAAAEAVYSHSTGATVWGPWDVYVASSDPNVGYSPVGGPDFNLGAGWHAVRVVAYAWNGSQWIGPTTNTWVPFPGGSYWCLGR